MFHANVLQKIKTYILCSINFSPESRAIYEIMWKNIVQPEQAKDDNTELSKKMDGTWNRYNLKSTGRIYTFGVLKCSEKFNVLDLP